MLEVSVYDYCDQEKKIKLPVDSVDEISEIWVEVLSGDETGEFKLKNGETVPFDASDDRCMTFFDGCYSVVEKENIESWINWQPESACTNSYQRQEEFC